MKVSPISLFRDVFNYAKEPIVSVSRLNGANSVWRATLQNGEDLVFKYFDDHGHAHSHFEVESNLYQMNRGVDLLDHFVTDFKDEELIILKFIDESNECHLSIAEIMDILDSEVRNLFHPPTLHNGPPGILSWWQTVPPGFGPGELLVMEIARSQPLITAAVREVQDAWSPEVLIHGDIKMSNLILSKSGLNIIDWESVGLGLSVWDLAGFFQSCIVEIIRKSKMAAWVHRRRAELEAIFNASEDLFTLSVASRLTQSAVEFSQGVSKISPSSVDMLQAAVNLLENNTTFLGEL